MNLEKMVSITIFLSLLYSPSSSNSKIVVVGDQSSGKSSVIESLCGIDLPRGVGCVTRCPIIIRMVKSFDKKYEILFGDNQTPLKDTSQLSQMILEEQDRKTKTKRGISDTPINITVYSPEVYDLTLIDLPGITRVPVDDQPKDIYEKIKEMIAKYINDPRTIILTVVPATVDISTTEAIKIAHEFDEKGIRTVGVLTKVDLMDRGTNASAILSNKSHVKLDLGIVAVKNRSKQDLDNAMSLKEARSEERKFFDTHPIYKGMKNLCGSENLAELLSKILLRRIKEELPTIKNEMETRYIEVKKKLAELGEMLPESGFEQQRILFREIEIYCTELRHSLDGDKINNTPSLGNPANEIYKLIYEYGHTVRKTSPEYFTEDYRKKIRIALDSSRGKELVGFLSFKVFTRIIYDQLTVLEEPSLDLVDDICGYLEKVMSTIAESLLSKYPLLMGELKLICLHFVEEKKKLTVQMVKDEIIKERFIFTNNHYYMDTLNKARAREVSELQESVLGTNVENFEDFTNDIQQRISKKLSVDNHEQEISDMIHRIRAYYKVVLKRIMDRVPQTINYYMIQGIYQEIQWKLQPLLERTSELLRENEMNAVSRKKYLEEKQTLEKAKQIMKKMSLFE